MNMFLAATALPAWLTSLLNALTNIVNPILIVAATAGIIYAVWVGIKFVKADEKNEREEAKQKLITVIIGVVVTGVLIALFYFLKTAFEKGWINLKGWYKEDQDGGGVTSIGNGLMDTVNFYANGFRAMLM